MWGQSPWEIPITVPPTSLPARADVAVVGAGLTGLSAALHLARSGRRVMVLEATRAGAGASGRTGGIAMDDTAAGPLPGFENCLDELKPYDCELELGGCWEIAHDPDASLEPMDWNDAGQPLRVMSTVPGGTVHPGKLLGAVARAALEAGVTIHENTPVESIESLPHQADWMILATNAYHLELSDIKDRVKPWLALGVATEPLGKQTVTHPFYTADLPYLWGRPFHDRMIFGSGLVAMDQPERARSRFRLLERRIRNLHPAFHDVVISHRWMGPIAIVEDLKPILRKHPRWPRVLFGGAYSGHGVAQSLRMGRLLAQSVWD